MITYFRSRALQMSAGFMAGMMMTTSAQAATKNFGSIASNIVTSIATLPALLAALSYMFGILLGVLGVLKIKDHVENPSQTPLKDGAIRLAAGGGLFALPIIYEAMINTVGNNGAQTTAATLNKVQFNVQ